MNSKTLQYNSIKFPCEVVNIILEYDGRIKYKYKKSCGRDYRKYVNQIHKNDSRYDVIKPVIVKKLYILNTQTKNILPNKNNFYFEFAFDSKPMLVLCYDYNWSCEDIFEICYTDMKDSGHVLGSSQIRTIYK